MAIDATGKYVIPGLWDMHIHPDDPEIYPLNPKEEDKNRLMPLFTLNGVTTARDMGGDLELLKRWRAKIGKGELVGPRLYFGGPLVDGPKPMWPGSIAVSNPEQGRDAVRTLKRGGADFVKVYSLLPKDAYLAICDEAKKLKMPVSGHVPDSVSIIEAVEAGQICQEHLLGFLREFCDRNAARRAAQELPAGSSAMARRTAILKAYSDTYNATKANTVYKQFVQKGIWHTPTLLVSRRQTNYRPDDPVIAPWLSYMPAYLRKHWTPEQNVHLGERRGDTGEGDRILEQLNFRMVREMQAAGVKLMAGSDCGGNPHMVPGFSLHEELAILVEAGLTPMQALQTATRNPAEFLGLLKTDGTLEKGKRADLVILDGDPLANISNTQRISSVLANGRLYGKSGLDAIREGLAWQGATGPVTGELRNQAEVLRDLFKTPLAQSFLDQTQSLPEPKVRAVYREKTGERRFISSHDFASLPADKQTGYDRIERPASFYYDTRYGSPLAYSRAMEVLGEAGLTSLSGKRILDFGYGGIGHLRLLASMGATAIGVDVDTLLKAYYSEPGDTGKIKAAKGDPGGITLVEGRFPADKPVTDAIGEGYDLFISKNTLKRGYIHPEREADPRTLINLGVDDEAFVKSITRILKPGGFALIYNLAPAPAPLDKPYIPWADGRSPFPKELWEKYGFEVLAFDKNDDLPARAMGKALGWDRGEAAMSLDKDLFGTYTLVRRK
jgi:imidazolonepropionase-like amidohydrolase/SAM-dependent methyltransferase